MPHHPVHPDDVLLKGSTPFPVIPACEHYAGSEKLMLKALALQDSLGTWFDVTCDCEDGAPVGQEQAHAEMIVRVQNSPANRHRMAGVRIHDPDHAHWKKDVDILVEGIGEITAYLTLPKAAGVRQVAEMIETIQRRAARCGIKREIPIHVLIETHGALREVNEIAALPWVQVLDFGLMDFISAHHGAIPASAMRSPGQFEHRLLARAKAEIVAAALAHGRVPAHNVTIDLKNPDRAGQDARRARLEFGFLRQWSVHPIQIMPIVTAMRPEHTETETAAAILLAAQAADWGPIRHEGELCDRAAYRYYWDVLQRARMTGLALPTAAELAFFGDRHPYGHAHCANQATTE